MRIIIIDETEAKYVAEYGHCTDSVNAIYFDTIEGARLFCDTRADLMRHRIVFAGFINREVVGMARIWAGHSLPEV
jgi:hypothetical protein